MSIYNSDTFNVVGIDPGNNLGVSILTVSYDNGSFTIKRIEPHTFVLDNYKLNVMLDRHVSRLIYLKEIITKICHAYQPLVVCLESAFMNSRFPKAVITLSTYVTAAELAIVEHNNFIKVFKYAPKYIKSEVCTGDADKKDMKKAISKIKELNSLMKINELSEHAIDATAMAYVGVKEIRQHPILLTLTS